MKTIFSTVTGSSGVPLLKVQCQPEDAWMSAPQPGLKDVEGQLALTGDRFEAVDVPGETLRAKRQGLWQPKGDLVRPQDIERRVYRRRFFRNVKSNNYSV